MTDSTCSECGHWIPPEDPTNEQVGAFIDDDSTKDCESCSGLWNLLMAYAFQLVFKEARERREAT